MQCSAATCSLISSIIDVISLEIITVSLVLSTCGKSKIKSDQSVKNFLKLKNKSSQQRIKDLLPENGNSKVQWDTSQRK